MTQQEYSTQAREVTAQEIYRLTSETRQGYLHLQTQWVEHTD